MYCNSYPVQYIFIFRHHLISNLHFFKQRLQNFKVESLYFEKHGMGNAFRYLMLIMFLQTGTLLYVRSFLHPIFFLISPLDKILLKLNPTCTCF